jgi:dodecin
MSVYRVTEVIGTSGTSWEEAAAEAIKTAGETIRDLRVAEVVKLGVHLDEGGGSPTAPSLSSRSSTNTSTDPWSASLADGVRRVSSQACSPMPGRVLTHAS